MPTACPSSPPDPDGTVLYRSRRPHETILKRVRYFLREPRHASAVLRIVHRAMEATIRRACPGAPRDARVGAVSFLQRFGSSLNPHLHVHDVITDGVFAWAGEEPEEGQDREIEFFEATDLADGDVEALTETIRCRVLRYLVRQDLLEDWDADQMLQWQGHGGFSVHAQTRVEEWDRMGLERLVRYCARPTFSLQQLHRLDDETLIYKLPKPDHRGRTELVLTPHELLQRLADLLPPPRMHRHRYYGCLAPNAAMRSAATATAGPDKELADRLDDAADKMGITGEEGPRRSNARWAMLIARIYESLPLQCTRCGAPMEILSFITDPDVVIRILDHLGEPSRPPEPTPARGPPQTEMVWEVDDAVWDEGVDDCDQTCWP